MHLGDILDILNEKAGGLTLHEAMYVARNIMELHMTGVQEANSNGYDEGYKSGHEMGKSIHAIPNPDQWEFEKAQRVYNFQKQKAQEVVKEAVQKHGTKRRIQVIKDVRNATGLGLKDSKDIVDKYIADLTAPLADWERDLLEGPHANYSDEPPF
ncbi:hypothetical protein SEA_ANGELA_260 [Streptomyces phage Angela]|nr:hypothetical protein SEA_ANGELA_3 [Streptomyces phage Angela]UVK61311.1 hypothetical protein SEA_ANGELA_260 [Streptomyces phage Angela]